MVWPDLVTITSGFTDFSTLLLMALALLGIALDFRLDVTGIGGKGFPDYVTPWYYTVLDQHCFEVESHHFLQSGCSFCLKCHPYLQWFLFPKYC